MDIQRPSSVARNKKIRHIIIGVVALAAIGVVTVALSRLKPAAPTVDRGTAYLDTVKRGPMVRQVRGLGTLVPEDIRWIPAATDGRVDRIVVYPGTPVTPETVILELSNPTQSQAMLEAEQQLKAAEAQYTNLQVQVANDLLAQEAAASAVRADARQAKLQAEADAELAKEGGLSGRLLTQPLGAVKYGVHFIFQPARIGRPQVKMGIRQTQLRQSAIAR